MLRKLKDHNVISPKLHSELIFGMQHEYKSEIELVTVHSSKKSRKLIVKLLERLDTLNPAILFTAYKSEI